MAKFPEIKADALELIGVSSSPGVEVYRAEDLIFSKINFLLI